MAKVQGKKAAAGKSAAKKAATRVKSAASAVKSKAAPRKSAPAAKPLTCGFISCAKRVSA